VQRSLTIIFAASPSHEWFNKLVLKCSADSGNNPSLRALLLIQTVLLTATLCVSPGASSRAAGLQVWTVDALERVDRAKRPHRGPRDLIHVYAARGEYESFQIAIRAEGQDAKNVRVGVEDFVGIGKIPAASVTLYREHYVQVPVASPTAHGSNSSLGTGWYPDALIPIENAVIDPSAKGFSVKAGTNQPIWIDIFVPRTAVPGSYAAYVRVSSDQGMRRIPVKLVVWNFELPLRPSLRTCFLVWKAKHQKTYEELLRNKISPCRVGGDANLSRLVSEFGLNTLDVGQWSGADNRSGNMKPSPSPYEWLTLEKNYPLDYQDRLLNYTADEVGGQTDLYERIKEWGRNIHALTKIKNLIVMPPDPRLYDEGTGRSAVDIWVVLPKQSSREDKAAISRGMEVWSYNALAQDGYSPKWLIDFRPIEYRIQPGWLNPRYGYTGLLYWRVDLWDGDVWLRPHYRTGSSVFAGEGLLIYPAEYVGMEGVLPSMRLKYLRDGIEDFEYYSILKGLGRETEALQIIRHVAPDWIRWTRDAAVLNAARKSLGKLIEHTVDARTPKKGRD